MHKRIIILLVSFFFWIQAFPQKQSISANGITISYQKFGTGFPVLIINGGPGMSSEGFIPLARMLSENNTTIIYDQRGTGSSGPTELNRQNISIDLMVEDIESLRKALGYTKWIVLGHSFGGMLAYAYAAKYPERVKAMIQSHSGSMDLDLLNSLNITSRLTPAQRDSLAEYSIQIRRGDTTHATALKRGEVLAHAYLYNEENIPQVAERLTQGNMRLNTLVWADMTANNFNTKPEMQKFNKPVLILNGMDEAVSENIPKKADAILPNSRLVMMERCGHYGWLDRPDIYLKEVRKFLKENS